MKFAAVVALVLLGCTPSFAQDQSSCKAFFQVVRAQAGSPGLRVGMSDGEKKWWESDGAKKYPGLCLNGTVTAGDKPRYIVILSKSKSIGSGTLSTSDVYGQSASALQATAPTAWIYRPRWNVESVTVVYITYDNLLEIPPVYSVPGDRSAWFFPHNRNALESAVKYLSQEMVFSPQVY